MGWNDVDRRVSALPAMIQPAVTADVTMTVLTGKKTAHGNVVTSSNMAKAFSKVNDSYWAPTD